MTALSHQSLDDPEEHLLFLGRRGLEDLAVVLLHKTQTSVLLVFMEMVHPFSGDNLCVCVNCFKFTCYLGSCIPSSRVDRMCVVFSCVQTVAWLLMLRIFNMHTDVNTCFCIQGNRVIE